MKRDRRVVAVLVLGFAAAATALSGAAADSRPHWRGPIARVTAVLDS
jgi:hypothetical protein